MAGGHLEKLVTIPIAPCSRVNIHESERERNGIICRQFCGVGEVAPIFRGAREFVGVDDSHFSYPNVYPLDTLPHMTMKDAGLRIRVERSLRDKFLETCREQDKPAAQVIRQFMRGYIDQHMHGNGAAAAVKRAGRSPERKQRSD